MLCVSIHDVAPATWSDCLRLVQAVREVADIPLTWLVVPHYHFRPERSLAMEACLKVVVERGDELALHGYSHLDTQANGGGLRGRFLRNVYTRREGEFAALDEAEARHRLEQGLAWFAERGWMPSGFIPPAWLLGKDAWRALRATNFAYTTTFSHFHCLRGADGSPQDRAVLSPSLVYAARNRGGRLLSPRVADATAAMLANAPLVRFSLHPPDARYPELLRHTQRVLERLLAQREAVTKAECARRLVRPQAMDGAHADAARMDSGKIVLPIAEPQAGRAEAPVPAPAPQADAQALAASLAVADVARDDADRADADRVDADRVDTLGADVAGTDADAAGAHVTSVETATEDGAGTQVAGTHGAGADVASADGAAVDLAGLGSTSLDTAGVDTSCAEPTSAEPTSAGLAAADSAEAIDRAAEAASLARPAHETIGAQGARVDASAALAEAPPAPMAATSAASRSGNSTAVDAPARNSTAAHATAAHATAVDASVEDATAADASPAKPIATDAAPADAAAKDVTTHPASADRAHGIDFRSRHRVVPSFVSRPAAGPRATRGDGAASATSTAPSSPSARFPSRSTDKERSAAVRPAR